MDIAGVDPSLVASRFWPRVDVGSPTECWVWTGESTTHGYGAVRPQGKGGPRIMAHRVAVMLTRGPIPDGLLVCHHCDNPPCVNPAHLFLGTVADNTADMWAKGRQSPPPRLAGATNPQAKLSESDVADIRARLESGESQMSIARDYPVTNHAIHLIAKGKKWATC